MEDHKDEGWLKSAWHRITHQHDNLEPEKVKEDKKEDKKQNKKENETAKDSNGIEFKDAEPEDEPKKASGSA